jgi:hypothetical protein
MSALMPVPFDIDCPKPLQHFLHRSGSVLLNMASILAIKNSVTCIGKQDYLQKIRLVNAHLNHPLSNLLPANVIIWLQCLHPLNMIDSFVRVEHATNWETWNSRANCRVLIHGFSSIVSWIWGSRSNTRGSWPLSTFFGRKVPFSRCTTARNVCECGTRAGNFSRYKACANTICTSVTKYHRSFHYWYNFPW